MKTVFALLIPVILSAPSVADACNCCAGWGISEAAREDVCAVPSAGLRDALVDCQRMKCSVECNTYLASYYACASAGPPCDVYVSPTVDDCDLCTAGDGAWAGIGCASENTACSLDQTGCLSCAEWVSGLGDPDNLCYAPGVSALSVAIDFGSCACSGACSYICAASLCPAGWLDLSLPMDAACSQCLQDTGSGCGNQLQTCFDL